MFTLGPSLKHLFLAPLSLYGLFPVPFEIKFLFLAPLRLYGPFRVPFELKLLFLAPLRLYGPFCIPFELKPLFFAPLGLYGLLWGRLPILNYCIAILMMIKKKQLSVTHVSHT